MPDERRGYSHAERRSWGRQARAMMSPSLAHKLWLTLWGLEGKEMEWNENAPSLCCGMASGEKMRGEMVMVRWGRLQRLLENLRMGEGHAATATNGSSKERPDLYDSVNLRWRRPLLSITWEENREKWREKKNESGLCSNGLMRNRLLTISRKNIDWQTLFKCSNRIVWFWTRCTLPQYTYCVAHWLEHRLCYHAKHSDPQFAENTINNIFSHINKDTHRTQAR